MAQRKPSDAPKTPKRPPVDAVTLSWIETESDWAAVAEGCWFDPVAAERVIFFFEHWLTHSKGQFAKEKFLLEPWQKRFLSRLYGWKKAGGKRRFTQFYLEVPKKNGKSTLISGMVLYAIFEEWVAEVYIGAVDRGQASIIFDEAARMVKASKPLAKRLKVIPSKKLIVYKKTDSKIAAMSADAPSKDGVSASFSVFDETHRHKNPDLHEVMENAGAAREQPLLGDITTAGDDLESLCGQLHLQALAIIRGEDLRTDFLAVIYAADPEDDIDDPATWMKANPSMPNVLKLDEFREKLAQAKKTIRGLNLFKRLRLNIWTSLASGWLDVKLWDARRKRIAPEWFEGRKCYAALDLSSRKDLTCLALLFPYGLLGRKVHLVPYFFMPEESVEGRVATDKVPYDRWAAEGFILLTPGNATDHEAIRLKLQDLAEVHEIERVGVDPWNAQHLSNLLAEDGFEVVGVGQSIKTLSEPSKDFEVRILGKTITHDGNPVMSMCVENTVVVADSNENFKPCKRRSTKRIDGVVAAIMGLYLHNFNKPKAKPKLGFFG